MGQGRGQGRFRLSRDQGYFAEDPRTGHLQDSLPAPLPPPSFEALIKHKSGSPDAVCQRWAGGETDRGHSRVRCAQCWTPCPRPFPGGPSTTCSAHRHKWQLELCFHETAVHSLVSPWAPPLADHKPSLPLCLCSHTALGRRG